MLKDFSPHSTHHYHLRKDTSEYTRLLSYHITILSGERPQINKLLFAFALSQLKQPGKLYIPHT